MAHADSTSLGSRVFRIILSALLIALAATTCASAQALDTYAVLGGSAITNTGVTTIVGNVGLSPGTAATGTGNSGADRIVLTGTLHITDAAAQNAKNDLTTAFNVLMGSATTIDLTGQTLGVGVAQTLTAGVYNFASSAQLNGTLTLNGNADDVFVFKIGSTLTTASGSAIVLGGTVKASNVFFVVGSSATLGTTTAFEGQILALTSITLNTAATINCGAAWAQNGQVTLDTNTIGVCTFAVAAGTFGSTVTGGVSGNQQAVIDAVNSFIDNGGTLPLAFSVLSLLTPDELAAALSELSGEVATGAAPAGNQAMDSLLDTILGNGSNRTVVAREAPPPGSNTVSVMGYTNSSQIDPGSALDSVAMATSGGTPDISQWTIWGAGFGVQSSVGGDLGTGAHAVTTQDFGYTIGFDHHVSADTLFGFAVSGGGTNFDLDDSLGSGRSAMLQAAAYAKMTAGNGYLSGILAYGAHDVTTDRYLDIGGASHYHAEFVAQDVAAAAEAGYKIGWFTPYVGVRVQGYLTPGYSEQTVSGSDIFALDYASHIDLSARTEIGLKMDASSDFGGGRLTVDGALAWAHSFDGGDTATASFQALPDSPGFDVAGAVPAADMLLVSAGLTADFDNGVSLGSTLDANLAPNARAYGASLRLGYSY